MTIIRMVIELEIDLDDADRAYDAAYDLFAVAREEWRQGGVDAYMDDMDIVESEE